MQILSWEELKAAEGREIGLTDWLVMDQDRIDAFARCTLDNHWCHVDVAAARDGFFGRTIAQSGLVAALITHFHEGFMAVPQGAVMGIHYGMDRLRHLSPVEEGAWIRDRMVLDRVEKKHGDRILTTVGHTVEIREGKNPACYAQTLTLFYMK